MIGNRPVAYALQCRDCAETPSRPSPLPSNRNCPASATSNPAAGAQPVQAGGIQRLPKSPLLQTRTLGGASGSAKCGYATAEPQGGWGASAACAVNPQTSTTEARINPLHAISIFAWGCFQGCGSIHHRRPGLGLSLTFDTTKKRSGEAIQPRPVATRTAPTVMRAIPAASRMVSLSPRKITAKIATKTTLSLSSGAT